MSQFILAHSTARQRAVDAVRAAPDGFVVRIDEPRRNLEQNAKLWACLADISSQVEWYGQHLSSEDWKHVFSAALHKQKAVPGLDGGFVVLGQSTSRMGKREFSDLIEIIHAFGAERGVQWSEPGLYPPDGRGAG